MRRHPGAEPANNDAERAAVPKRKIAGLTRSGRGNSAHESCRSQSRGLPDWLPGCIQTRIGRFVPPSLLPIPQPSN